MGLPGFYNEKILDVWPQQKSPKAMTGVSGVMKPGYPGWYLIIFLSLSRILLEEGAQWVLKLNLRMAVQHVRYTLLINK